MNRVRIRWPQISSAGWDAPSENESARTRRALCSLKLAEKPYSDFAVTVAVPEEPSEVV